MPKLIQSAIKNDLPEGAIRIPEEKVVQFYSNLLVEWQPKSDVWALAYGPEAMGVLAAASGFHVNWYFRRALALKKIGFFSTYLPNTVIPMMLVNVIHQHIQAKLLVNQEPTTTHLEMTAALGQVFGAVIQPLLGVPFSAFMYATRHFTVRIPSPTQETRKFFRYWGRLYVPFRYHIAVNVGLQAIAAVFLVKMQDSQFQHMAESLVDEPGAE